MVSCTSFILIITKTRCSLTLKVSTEHTKYKIDAISQVTQAKKKNFSSIILRDNMGIFVYTASVHLSS